MLRQARLALPIALVGTSLFLFSCERSTVAISDDKPTLSLASATAASATSTLATPPPASSAKRFNLDTESPWDLDTETPGSLKIWTAESQTFDEPYSEYRISPQLGWVSSRPDSPGVLTEIRWANSIGATGHSLYVSIYIDRAVGGSPDIRLPIRSELRNAATSFKEGEFYRVPLGSGIQFRKNFTIVFGSRPNLTPAPPLVPKAQITGIAVAWRDSWKPISSPAP